MHSHFESLEERKLLASVALGYLPLGHRATYIHSGVDYSFRLGQPTVVAARVTAGTVTLLRNGLPLASGSSISRPVTGTGGYELRIDARFGTNLDFSTGTMAPPTRLEAEVWGGNAVKLNWDDNTVGEAQYRVDRWTRDGWRRATRVPANQTVAVLDTLVPGYKTTYRVSAVSPTGESVGGTNIMMVTSGVVDESGWYKISLEAAKKGEASWSMQSDTLKILPDYQDGDVRKSKWVYASSWQNAVWQYVRSYEGSDIEAAAPVIVNTHKKNGGSDILLSHYLPGSGSFRINTVGAIKAEVAQKENNNGGFKTNLPDDAKVITIEDSYETIDRDYDDFYWRIAATKLQNATLDIQFTTFIKQNFVLDPRGWTYVFNGNDRGLLTGSGPAQFDRRSDEFKTRQNVVLKPWNLDDTDGVVDGSYKENVGPTILYHAESSLETVNLWPLDNPFERIKAEAKADSILNDNYLKHDVGVAWPRNWSIASRRINEHVLELTATVDAANPLIEGAPGINYAYVVRLDVTDPNQVTWTLTGDHDGFPCYEIYINDTRILGYDSGNEEPTALFPPMDKTVNVSGSIRA